MDKPTIEGSVEDAAKLVGETPAWCEDGTHAIVAAILWGAERIARAIESQSGKES